MAYTGFTVQHNVFPREQGWSGPVAIQVITGQVFPARAGVVLARSCPEIVRWRSPRASGVVRRARAAKLKLRRSRCASEEGLAG
ncbi:hypothetical protein [Amycolatopsis circi]|uniref:hypothetical protein n=1 Tax=Amycolatopsis circi TaxID=871959 RepID=UPI000E286E98|nr:hypothetical protein [Amycolatopsis circi]